MADANVPLYALNRGLIDKLALARIDLSRTALSAEVQTNFMPQQLGPISARVGWEYQGSTKDNAKAYHIPFVFSQDDSAELELTDKALRVWVNDTPVSRESVSTQVFNGEFTTDLSSWSDDDDAGCTSEYDTGRMSLLGTGNDYAKRYQNLIISPSDTGKLHTLRVVVERGPVTFKVGSVLGSADLLSETSLDQGTHSLQFLPAGTSACVQLSSSLRYAVLVGSVTMESAGAMELATPWKEADLKYLRYEVSGNVIYVACEGYPQYVIERRQYGSWSVVRYLTTDGPFGVGNSTPVTITPSALNGDITLEASSDVFSAAQEGALLRLTSTGQEVQTSFSDELQYSDHIQVTGITSGRVFAITRSGTWTGSIKLQRSVESPGAWIDVATYTTNGTTNYDDDLDNQITFYRLAVNAGDWTSGTADVTLDYDAGFIDGVVQLDSVSSTKEATGHVVRSLGGTVATSDWAIGQWYTGNYPTTTLLAEGRLWWFGRGKYNASVSDLYDSHDSEYEGDAGPISRGIGFGPVDRIHWALPLQHLIIGTSGRELALRSSNDSEVLTNANINVRGGSSSQGSYETDAVDIDGTGIFAQRSGRRVYTLDYEFEPNSYLPNELTLLVPRLCKPGIVRLVVQRQPDTRIHVILANGKVAMCLFNKAEDLTSWVLLETDGVIEDAVVVADDDEDKVIYIVKRTVNGATVRYRERWSLEDDSRIYTTRYEGDATTEIPVEYEDGTRVTVRDAYGVKLENTTVSNNTAVLTTASAHCYVTPSLCKRADSFLVYDGVPTTTISGLGHLEGESVVVWADGKAQGTFTVSGGAVFGLAEEVELAVVGKTFRARWRSTKLAYADAQGTALLQLKKLSQVGVVGAYIHPQGVMYGRNFTDMYPLPLAVDGDGTQADFVYEDYDQQAVEFPGTYNTDSRLCLQVDAPYPATISGAVIEMETDDD